MMIAYHRAKNIAGAIAKLKAEMNENRPLEQKGPTQESPIKWSFLSVHGHSSGEDIEVAHYGCNLHHPSIEEVATVSEDDSDKDA